MLAWSPWSQRLPRLGLGFAIFGFISLFGMFGTPGMIGIVLAAAAVCIAMGSVSSAAMNRKVGGAWGMLLGCIFFSIAALVGMVMILVRMPIAQMLEHRFWGFANCIATNLLFLWLGFLAVRCYIKVLKGVPSELLDSISEVGASDSAGASDPSDAMVSCEAVSSARSFVATTVVSLGMTLLFVAINHLELALDHGFWKSSQSSIFSVGSAGMQFVGFVGWQLWSVLLLSVALMLVCGGSLFWFGIGVGRVVALWGVWACCALSGLAGVLILIHQGSLARIMNILNSFVIVGVICSLLAWFAMDLREAE